MIRFYIALWASKFYLFISKLRNKTRSDRAGLLAAKICPNILEYIKKPELVIMVSGTNGKTTTTSLIAQILKDNNKKVQYNDWGANFVSGHIRCLLDCVNIFNRSTKDAAVIECDELISIESVPKVKPNYLLVTNLCRDSIRRNAYPEYIFNRLNEAIKGSPGTTLILNSMDPISSNLGPNNKKIFVSVENIFEESYQGLTDDCGVCLKCNHKLTYEYRHYRHIGKFKCTNCNNTIKPDYTLSSIKNGLMTVNKTNYNIISNHIFNIYNELMIIALLNEMKFTKNEIINSLKNIHIPENREKNYDYKDYKINMLVTKGQNGSASSTVFETLNKNNKPKELILLLDEVFGSLKAMETITWIYDTDFELLNKKEIKKIIVGGERYLDYKTKMLLSGIDEDKIVCIPNFMDTYKYLSLDKNNNIYILNDVDRISDSKKVIDKIYERIDSEK